MNRPHLALPSLLHSLSARLLVLTVAFVMVSEILIFVPSVSRFRLSYLEDKLADSTLALLALEATPDNMVSQELANQLLRNVGAYSVMPEDMGRVSSTKLRGVLALEMPPAVQKVIDLRDESMAALMSDALMTLFGKGDRVVMVVGTSPREPRIDVDVTIGEKRLREAMVDFAARLFGLSLVISVITAALVYLSLQWLLVRPMRRITASMIRFRLDPEDATHGIPPSERHDEIGIAERELADMQETVRQALRQHARLAALGTAVTKIHHDLRNILSTALLVSDQIAESAPPEIRKFAPRLVAAIERASKLCGSTLAFTREGAPPLTLVRFPLATAIEELAGSLPLGPDGPVEIEDATEEAIIRADRDQVHRLLLNLARNAIEAGASHLTVSAVPDMAGGVAIDIADNGHGLPPKARENLFRPFAGSARPGGTGLGLAICREIARAHGGELLLIGSSAEGTRFRLLLPTAWAGRQVPQALTGTGAA